jgi:hypothetical protein
MLREMAAAQRLSEPAGAPALAPAPVPGKMGKGVDEGKRP